MFLGQNGIEFQEKMVENIKMAKTLQLSSMYASYLISKILTFLLKVWIYFSEFFKVHIKGVINWNMRMHACAMRMHM